MMIIVVIIGIVIISVFREMHCHAAEFITSVIKSSHSLLTNY
jgi:hypothetical protein